MITAKGIELRAGSRLLLDGASFRVNPGDRIGLVGRNGAGKTTLTKVLAGEALPAAGEVTRSGTVGYLPQDPRTGDLDVLARDRILSARGLDEVIRQMRAAEERMANAEGAERDKAVRRYGRLEDIPVDPASWDVSVRGAAKLGVRLQEQYDDALLFRLIATINTDAPTIANVDELRWTGPKPELAEVARHLDAPLLIERAEQLAAARA